MNIQDFVFYKALKLSAAPIKKKQLVRGKLINTPPYCTEIVAKNKESCRQLIILLNYEVCWDVRRWYHKCTIPRTSLFPFGIMGTTFKWAVR